ncbi:MAG: type II toxin-antitoxin system VapC family toxin [Acidobacteria bacterium]|nr:type II toxin-antitoxin system VapC family toxin [Acidobacteriota bacterium]MBI3426608.1 type II toxin-antitoxin system VapC family toxin [Acidobacteriota bacterium]
MIRYVLDTDHLSLAQRGHQLVTARLTATQPGAVAITIITAEEQLRGRFLQIRKFPNGLACVAAYRQLHETIADLNTLPILDFDPVAETLDQSLRKQWPRLDTQDRRIAAITLAQQCILVTRNAIHFGQIAGLTLQDWTK